MDTEIAPIEEKKHLPFRERLTCSIDDAVAATGLSRTSVYELMRAGRIRFVKIGTRRLIAVGSLLAALGE